MAKYTVIPGYIDESGKHFVMNVITTLFEPYNPSKQKTPAGTGIKIVEGPMVYKCNFGRDNKLIICFPSTKDTVRGTVFKQEYKKVWVRLPDGKEVELNYTQVIKAVTDGKINGLKIINGMIYVDEDPKSSYFKVDVPDYLKDIVDTNWNILSNSGNKQVENESIDSQILNEPNKNSNNITSKSDVNTGDKTGIQSANFKPAYDENSEQSKANTESSQVDSTSHVNFENLVKIKLEQDLAKQKEESVAKEKEVAVDLKFKVNSENKNDKLPEMTYLDFYKEMINNSRVGDILSIPRCLLEDLRVEYIKLLEGSFSGRHQTVISKVKTGNSISNISISIIGMQEDSEYCTMQIMSKPLDENSISVQDIDVEYYKWKQSRKYIQG